MDQFPAHKLGSKLKRHIIFSHVLNSVPKGYSALPDGADGFCPYSNICHELSCHLNCLMWGNRTIIPEKHRDKVLQDLHEGHFGIVKMKSIARSNVWWPKIDKDVEDLYHSSRGCQKHSNMLKSAPVHLWDCTKDPWERLHRDFAVSFINPLFLIIVDVHCKWLEIFPMTTTTSNTNEKFSILFSQLGLPKVIVSDNGPQFVSDEFRLFVAQNGIKHITSAPYHLRTNGQAERLNQVFQKAMRSAIEDLVSIQHHHWVKKHSVATNLVKKIQYKRISAFYVK